MIAAFVNFLVQVSIASSLIFIPLFAKELGASDLEIGLITSFYSLSIFISSWFFGRLSDLYEKNFAALGLVLSSIFFALQSLASNSLQLLIVRTLLGFSLGIFPAALMSYAYKEEKKIGYFSAFGSLGWAFGQLAAGIIMFYDKIFIFGSILTFIAFATSFFKIKPIKILTVRSQKRILKENFRIYFAFFLRHVGASAVWLVFPIYLHQLGISKFWIGVIYFANSFMQFFMMPRVEKFSSEKLITSGAIFSAFTFIFYSFLNCTWQFILIQFLIAFGWSSIYVGALKALLEKNEEKGSVVGFLNSTIYFSTIVGSVFGGIIAEIFDYRSCMIFGAILCLLAAVIRDKR
ncbi:MAG: MFS transporter [Archaeoglobaceae archaeon]|nr:MFS transporter [Archaeoglobaceae archaeon]MDW8013509.1 MFS transporter [Archaeoglobaceae archaeon]